MRFQTILSTVAVLCVPAVAVPHAGAQTGPTTVVLVRHAEKVDGPDPSLSAEGRMRVAALVDALTDVHFDAVLTTPYARTRETARPFAGSAGVPLTETPVTRTFAADVAARVLQAHRGGTVLVVGHSNTTPAVIRALGVASVEDLSEEEYDDLFVVTVEPDGAARLLHLHYGRKTP